MLGLDFRGGVHVLRIEPGVLAHGRPGEVGPAPGAPRLEPSIVEIEAVAGSGADLAVLGAAVAALAVDDHRGGDDQAARERAAPQGAQQVRGPAVVVRDIVAHIVEVDAEAHPRGLMADGVDALDRALQRPLVPEVADDELDRAR